MPIKICNTALVTRRRGQRRPRRSVVEGSECGSSRERPGAYARRGGCRSPAPASSASGAPTYYMIHGSIRYGRPPTPPMGSCFCFLGDRFWIWWVVRLMKLPLFSGNLSFVFSSPFLVCGEFCVSEITKLLYVSRLRINETVELRPAVFVGIIFYLIVFEEIINADFSIICNELVNHKGIQLSLIFLIYILFVLHWLFFVQYL